MANIGEKKSNFVLFMISEFEFESHALLFFISKLSYFTQKHTAVESRNLQLS